MMTSEPTHGADLESRTFTNQAYDSANVAVGCLPLVSLDVHTPTEVFEEADPDVLSRGEVQQRLRAGLLVRAESTNVSEKGWIGGQGGQAVLLNVEKDISERTLILESTKPEAKKRQSDFSVDNLRSKSYKVEQQEVKFGKGLANGAARCREPCGNGSGIERPCDWIEKQSFSKRCWKEGSAGRDPTSVFGMSEVEDKLGGERAHECDLFDGPYAQVLNVAADNKEIETATSAELSQDSIDIELLDPPLELGDGSGEADEICSTSVGARPEVRELLDNVKFHSLVSKSGNKRARQHSLMSGTLGSVQNSHEVTVKEGCDVEPLDSTTVASQTVPYDCNRWHYDYFKGRLWIYNFLTNAYHAYGEGFRRVEHLNTDDISDFKLLPIERVQSVQEIDGQIHVSFTEHSIVDSLCEEEANSIQECYESLSRNVHGAVVSGLVSDQHFVNEGNWKIKDAQQKESLSRCPGAITTGNEAAETDLDMTHVNQGISEEKMTQVGFSRAGIASDDTTDRLEVEKGVEGEISLLETPCAAEKVYIQDYSSGWYYHHKEQRWYCWNGHSWAPHHASASESKYLAEDLGVQKVLGGSRREAGGGNCRSIEKIDEADDRVQTEDRDVETASDKSGKSTWMEDMLIEAFLQRGKDHVKRQQYSSVSRISLKDSTYRKVSGADAWVAALQQVDEHVSGRFSSGQRATPNKKAESGQTDYTSGYCSEYRKDSQEVIWRWGNQASVSVSRTEKHGLAVTESVTEALEEGEIAAEESGLLNGQKVQVTGDNNADSGRRFLKEKTLHPAITESETVSEKDVRVHEQGRWKWEFGHWVWVDCSGASFIVDNLDCRDQQKDFQERKARDCSASLGRMKDDTMLRSYNESHEVQGNSGDHPFTSEVEGRSDLLAADSTSCVPGLEMGRRWDESVPEQQEVNRWSSQFEASPTLCPKIALRLAEKAKVLGATDLWDWGVTAKENSRKRTLCLTGRAASAARMLHPSLGASGGLIKAGAVEEAEGNLVRVSTGKVYRLRRPSQNYLTALDVSIAPFNSSNPTESWGLPSISVPGDKEERDQGKALGERSKGPTTSKPFVLNKGLLEEQLLSISARFKCTVGNNFVKKERLLPSSSFSKSADRREERPTKVSRKDRKGLSPEIKYRDRAAERRSLHRDRSSRHEGQSTAESGRSEGSDRKSSRHTSSGRERRHTGNNKGKDMLKAMEWQEGQLLGKSGGLKEPLEAVVNKGRAGVGWHH